ncbi:hypothetical protein [Prevotella dentasini]|nr:hypothetical protein [Prevotella dentasini]
MKRFLHARSGRAEEGEHLAKVPDGNGSRHADGKSRPRHARATG